MLAITNRQWARFFVDANLAIQLLLFYFLSNERPRFEHRVFEIRVKSAKHRNNAQKIDCANKAHVKSINRQYKKIDTLHK